VVLQAAKRGLSAIAITDHDSIGGISEALGTGARNNIEVVPGIELTAMHRDVETHILGYYIHWEDRGIADLLAEITQVRRERVAEMINCLKRKKGFDIAQENVFSRAEHGSVGRPHIASELVKLGYIKKTQEAFTDELIGNGGECYRPVCELTVKQAIEIIRDYSGIPVLAHPGYWSGPGGVIPEEDILDFIRRGLVGLECRHHRHSAKMASQFEELASRIGLLKTGGSDCHGTYYNPIKMGTVAVPEEWLEKLKEIALAKEAVR
jgi:hypothetical protein